jgi:TatD DNase family protein
MQFDYIDIHSHLNLAPLTETQEAVLAKMRELNIGTITVGTGLETSQVAIEIAEKNPDLCFATVGFHPCDGHVPSEEIVDGKNDWDQLETMAHHKKVVAIGETGLDYFHENTPESRAYQTDIFKKHIALAVRVGKPLMLHVRSSKGSDDAYFDALEILKVTHYTGKANFHFFSGSRACMEAIVAAGYTISVDGPITFVSEYDEMIRAVPIDRIMVETDAPYAAPKPYRGKTCEPWMVVEVARRIAELKGLDSEEVRRQLVENTRQFFAIDYNGKI